MVLKDFIKETLTQIVSGIEETNAEIVSKSAFVVSSNIQASKDNCKIKATIDKSRNYHVISDVDFDVAISTQDSEKVQGGGQIQVLSFLNLGSNGSSENLSSSVSRVKFTIPLALPTEPDEVKLANL